MSLPKDTVVAVIGLGYVGLPLAIGFGKKFRTIGFDLKESLIQNYAKRFDPTGEVAAAEFEAAARLECTSRAEKLAEADFIVVAVPTPVDSARKPDLTPVQSAAFTAGRNLKSGCTVVFESTVYPGVTEDICVPILEKASGKTWKKDFFVGYSPERINPGDKEHTLSRIVKVVSGDTPATLERVANLYESVVDAGVYRVSRIKEAEAAKVIENTQRDLNIALMNELAVIFDRLGIDTQNVLKAAGTKWNFLPFRPGLVGGHCIGVDPYYLTYKAETVGYHPEVILAGRRINDNMGKFIAEKTVKMLSRTVGTLKDMRVGVLGLTFKENCPDLRNTRVVDIVTELQSFGLNVIVHDPIADPADAENFYNIRLQPLEAFKGLGALVIAVAHRSFLEIPVKRYVDMLGGQGCLIDIKSILDPGEVKRFGVPFWRL